jgi:pimeloyl-ACP methyl ester carboxylesterase
VSDGRLALGDGRTLAWKEYGPADGRPVLHFQGTPGSRYSRHAHEDVYERLGVRLVIFDRPGYGASDRLPGRAISVVADDAARLLDRLELDTVRASGGSGGGPHVLAFAANHPERVEAATVVVGMTPLNEEDVAGLIQINRDAWYATREGWDALRDLLAPMREEVLKDPLAGFKALMETAPPSDKAVMEDPDWQRVLVESVTEAFRPGAEGWVDEGMALNLDWDFDVADVRCSVTWWHGDSDANAPLAPVHRLIDRMGGVDLRVWTDVGHLEPYHRYEEILGELLSR